MMVIVTVLVSGNTSLYLSATAGCRDCQTGGTGFYCNKLGEVDAWMRGCVDACLRACE